jgi:hypothetical protein
MTTTVIDTITPVQQIDELIYALKSFRDSKHVQYINLIDSNGLYESAIAFDVELVEETLSDGSKVQDIQLRVNIHE